MILAFPCNQFGRQEWPKNPEIPQTLHSIRPGNGYVPLFPLFAKNDVNGATTQPVFQFLRDRCLTGRNEISDDVRDIIWSPVTVSDISWNFEKFLIDRDGNPVYRYPDKWDPEDLVPDIEALLAKPASV